MLRKFLSLRLLGINQRPVARFTSSDNGAEISLNSYHEASDNTLEELSEKLELALEPRYDKGADVSLNNGVLTVVVDQQNTYVINKQTPNRQLWLSSPISGPMRFDFVQGRWVEKRTKTDLNSLLSEELSQLLKNRFEC